MRLVPGFTERMDIYYCRTRLKSALQHLDREPFPPQDRQAIRAFAAYLEAQGLSLSRIAKYVFELTVLRRHLPCPFRKATKRTIERLMAWLNQASGYQPHTKKDLKGALKRFYKWLRYGTTDRERSYPPEVAWIRENVKLHQEAKPRVLGEAAAKTLIDAADKLRDKAMISVVYEGGFRVGELLPMHVGDVAFDEHGARARVQGKTGERLVRLIAAAPLLARYLEQHPGRREPTAPLWYTSATNWRMQPLGYLNFCRILRAIAEKAGVKQRIHPHLFRHSAATRDAKFLSDSELKVKYGWGMGSRMPAIYVHLAGKDVDEKLIAVYSGRPIEPPPPEFQPVLCVRCGERNTQGLQYCGRCATPLDPAARSRASLDVAVLAKRLEQVEALLRSLLAGAPEQLLPNRPHLVEDPPQG